MALTKKAERTKAKLLDSAQRLISAHGFDNVSVEDITKDSGVAKGTFYHYFECKEDVVRELSRKTAMATIERAIAHEGDVIERCCFYFGEIYKDCMWSGVRLVRQWLRDSVENKHAHPEQNTEALYDLYLALEKILSTHQGEGKGERPQDHPLPHPGQPLHRRHHRLVHAECLLRPGQRFRKLPEARHRKSPRAVRGEVTSG